LLKPNFSNFIYFNAADAEAAAKTTKRSKKEAVRIDFLTPCDKGLKELTKELFAPATKGAGINLPGTGTTAANKKSKKTKEKRDEHRLPDDIHFSSRQLVTLFLKPKFVVCFFHLILKSTV
jgi:condensin complex subunit 2